MWQLTKNEFWKLISLVAGWRIVLLLSGYYADNFLRYAPTFPYARELLPSFGVDRWLYSWAGFDGVHYLTIAEKGYVGTGLIQAFFPVFPLLMRILSVLTQNHLLSGLLISTAATILTVLMLFSFVKQLYSAPIAWRTIWLFLLFPTSFFLGALYNESLFLVFVLGAFFCAYHKQWLAAGILAGFASATRVVGIFVVVGLLVGLFVPLIQKNKKYQRWSNFMVSFLQEVSAFCKKSWFTILLLLLGSLGLLLYMYYLWQQFGDPLYFAHVQSEFGAGREEQVVLLPQTLWRALKIVLTVPHDLRFITYVQELGVTLLVLIGLLFGFRKKTSVPYSWLVFAFLAVLLPTSTGTLSSMPRYVLVAFPFFVILAQAQLPRTAWYAIYLISAALLLWNTVLFIQGYWVA